MQLQCQCGELGGSDRIHACKTNKVAHCGACCSKEADSGAKEDPLLTSLVRCVEALRHVVYTVDWDTNASNSEIVGAMDWNYIRNTLKAAENQLK